MIGSKPLAETLLILCVLTLCCDRTPEKGKIEGRWQLSSEARVLLGISSDKPSANLDFFKGGELRITNVPSHFVYGKSGFMVSATGHWQLPSDGSASVLIQLDIHSGQVSSILEVLEIHRKLVLAAWLDEPGGQALILERIGEPIR